MNNVVLSGSLSLGKKIDYWVNCFKSNNYEVLDYPKLIANNKDRVNRLKEYYHNLENTDVYFLINEDKGNIKGYIGLSSFAELNYVIILNILHNRNILIYLLNKPVKVLTVMKN